MSRPRRERLANHTVADYDSAGVGALHAGSRRAVAGTAAGFPSFNLGKNMLKKLMLAAGLLACAACTQGSGSGSGGGERATVAECRQMLEKGMELGGIPVAAMTELVEAGAQKCGDGGPVTKDHYRCVMAATNTDESRACNVPI